MARAWETAGDIDERYRHEPATPAIPIWLAGTSDAALSRTARVADGWVPLFIPPVEYQSTRRRLFDLAAEEGRDPAAIDTSVVAVVCVGDSAEIARKEGTAWLSDLYALPPKAFDRHLIAGPAEDCAAGIAAYHDAGADHVVVMVAADETLDHFGPADRGIPVRVCRGHFTHHRTPGSRPMSTDAVAVLGTAMTDMSRRDLHPDQMALQVVDEAVADAGVGPDDLALVVSANASGGRLNDQGCIRGQAWLRKSALGDVPIVNVDNSCAGGSSALHLGTLAARAQDRPVLVLGVEKMWTGDRAATLEAIESGLPVGLPGRHARPAGRARQPGRQHPHGAERRRGRPSSWTSGAPPSSRSRPPPSRPAATGPSTRWPSASRP